MLQPLPGSQPDDRQQDDDQRSLQVEVDGLEGVQQGNGNVPRQMQGEIAAFKYLHLQRPGDQDGDHQTEEDPHGWFDPPGGGEQGLVRAGRLFAEEKSHQQTDADAEDDGKHDAGNGDIHTDGGSRVSDG